MQTVRSQLFEGITNEECARMFQCFGAREAGYEAGALISEFDGEQNAVGVLLSGSADLVRLDADGNLLMDGVKSFSRRKSSDEAYTPPSTCCLLYTSDAADE